MEMNRIVLIGIFLVCCAALGVFYFMEREEDYEVKEPAVEDIVLNEILDIEYYDSRSDKTKLNIIIPEGAENPPVFLWIGGGAWAYVDRNKEMDLCRKMAKQGILMISVGHRLSPALIWEPIVEEGIKHPEHVRDIAKAFKWVYDHSDEYGYSKDNIFVGGFSSGAHLSALLAADKKYLQEVGLSVDDINAIIPVGGGYDIPHYKDAMKIEDPSLIEKHINPVFGETLEEQLDASPITFIDDFNTPMLMISENYTYPFTELFEKALSKKKFDKFMVLNFHNESHGSLWKKLSNEEDCIYRNYIGDYIKSRVK